MKTKIGFWWFNQGGPCDGVQPTYRQAWWGGTPFYMESLNVFLGATLIPPGFTMDLNVQIGHSNGNMIHVAWADRYQPSSGIADVNQIRYFATPWVFQPGDALEVIPYALGPKISGSYPQWGVGIQVEGYLE